MKAPRLLIEEWLPAAAIGVECMRERGTALAPHTFVHVWWARRPLRVCRAAHDRTEFRRMMGYRDLWMLKAALDQNKVMVQQEVA